LPLFFPRQEARGIKKKKHSCKVPTSKRLAYRCNEKRDGRKTARSPSGGEKEMNVKEEIFVKPLRFIGRKGGGGKKKKKGRLLAFCDREECSVTRER